MTNKTAATVTFKRTRFKVEFILIVDLNLAIKKIEAKNMKNHFTSVSLPMNKRWIHWFHVSFGIDKHSLFNRKGSEIKFH